MVAKGYGYIVVNDDIREGHIVVLEDKILFREPLSKTETYGLDIEYEIEQSYYMW